MSEEIEKIKFIDGETKEEVWFEIIDEVMIDQTKYLLVVDEDNISTILKQIDEINEDLEYTLIEDENEFKRVATEFMSNEAYDIEI